MADSKNKITALGTTLSFFKVGACSETLINVINRVYDNPLMPEENATAPFAGGIKQHGYQCGMIWGAALAAGAQAYQLYGSGPEAETRALLAAQGIVDSFQEYSGEINCYEITEIDNTSSTLQMITYFLLKGGSIGCFRMAAKYAPLAFEDIEAALSEENIEVPSAPVSCAALLAEKMGVSERQVVMAAGLAGGIGLCGGACGALGAAIWIMGMKLKAANAIKDFWKDETLNKKFDSLLERFLKKSDYEFECSKIVGRNFDSVEDHAAYVCNGGCAELIEVLAAEGANWPDDDHIE